MIVLIRTQDAFTNLQPWVILKIFAYVYISNINEVIRSVLNFFIFFLQ